MLNRGQGALREFLRTPEECDFAFFEQADLNAEDGWRVVVVAAISNLIFKAGAVAALGRRRLFVRILPAYGIVITVGVLMLLYRYFAF